MVLRVRGGQCRLEAQAGIVFFLWRGDWVYTAQGKVGLWGHLLVEAVDLVRRVRLVGGNGRRPERTRFIF